MSKFGTVLMIKKLQYLEEALIGYIDFIPILGINHFQFCILKELSNKITPKSLFLFEIKWHSHLSYNLNIHKWKLTLLRINY